MAKRSRSKAPATEKSPSGSPPEGPEAVVRGFIADMNAWELWCVEGKDARDEAMEKDLPGAEEQYRQWRADQSQRQQTIFDRWCTPKERKYGRLGKYSQPPEYQPDKERIAEVTQRSAKKVEVQTDRTSRGSPQRRMYVVLLHEGRWLIDAVKWQKSSGTWTSGIL